MAKMIARVRISTAQKAWEPGDSITASQLKGEPECGCHDSVWDHYVESGRIGSGD